MWRQSRALVLASVAVAVLVGVGPGQTAVTGKVSYEHLKAMQTATSSAERAYVTETFTLFRIIDPKFARRALRNIDYRAFRHRVENEWKLDHAERWNRVAEILDFCRTEGLATAIDDVDPDSRWELFLRYGKPRFNTPFTIRCRGGDEECTCWNFTFYPQRPGEPPPTASCLIQPGMSYPTEILATQEQSLPDAQTIFPSVTFSRFYGDDPGGDVDLWFSIWYSGSEFTRATVDGGELTTTVELWDKSRTKLLLDSTATYSLDAVRGVLKAMQKEFRAKVRVMRYMRFRVKPQTYAARVRVKGADRFNEGGGWYEDPIVVPAGSDMSDLLILAPNLVQGAEVAECIRRGNELYLCNNPEGWIPKNGTLDLYAEFSLPETLQDLNEVEARVTMRPLPQSESRSMRRGHVAVGDGFVQHFDGRPFLGLGSREKWEERVKEFFGDVDEPEYTILEQPLDIDPAQIVQRLNLSCPLQDGSGRALPSGKYLLTLRIEGCGTGCFPAASRTIQIVVR